MTDFTTSYYADVDKLFLNDYTSPFNRFLTPYNSITRMYAYDSIAKYIADLIDRKTLATILNNHGIPSLTIVEILTEADWCRCKGE